MKEGATATRGCRRGLGATCEWLRGFKVAWLRKGTTDTAACGWLRGFGVVWFERGYHSHITCGWLGGVLEGRVGATMVAT